MNSTGKKVAAVCALALVVVLIAAFSANGSSGGTDIFSGIINYITQPIKAAASAVTEKVDDLLGYITDYDRLAAENEQLKAQIAELQDEHVQYIENIEENERLRNLLKLTENNRSYEYAEADIIAWTGSTWSSSFTINAGESLGIALNDCVINEFGHVIGIVTEVGVNSSVVTTILDTTSSIGAKVLETNDPVVASGKFELFPEGKLALTYMPDEHEIVNGYSVITSGTGGICPAGLVIGTVSGLEISSSHMYDYAIVEPAADFDSLSAVFVITSY